MTDAEKFVRESLPDVCLGGPMKNGRYHPEGGYMLFASSSCSGPFACGKTATETWANAANRIAREAQRQEVEP